MDDRGEVPRPSEDSLRQARRDGSLQETTVDNFSACMEASSISALQSILD